MHAPQTFLLRDVTLAIPRDQLPSQFSAANSHALLSGEGAMSRGFDAGGPALKIWLPDSMKGDPVVQPGLFEGQDQGSDTRIMNPGVLPEPENSQEVKSLFAELRETHKSGPQPVPAGQVQEVRETRTLPEFYADWMADRRAMERKNGDVTSGTLSKERQALRRWTEWELRAGKPACWPDHVPWRGCPIGFIAGGYLDCFYSDMAKRYSHPTIVSTRNHLRTILNFAVAVKALAEAPQPKPLEAEESDDLEEDLATVWTEPELNSLYDGMAGRIDMQTALVLGVNCGPRTVDLFGLIWEKNFRLDEEIPRLRFRAVKTGKVHGIPLHPVAVAHLRRLQREQLFEPTGAVFPRLTSLAAKDQEKSKAARSRNALVKKVLASADLPVHERPWQVTRATCCTRLNSHRRGAKLGSWVIGQGTDRAGTKVAADFYDNPTQDVIEAILSAPQPAAFARILK